MLCRNIARIGRDAEDEDIARPRFRDGGMATGGSATGARFPAYGYRRRPWRDRERGTIQEAAFPG